MHQSRRRLGTRDRQLTSAGPVHVPRTVPGACVTRPTLPRLPRLLSAQPSTPRRPDVPSF